MRYTQLESEERPYVCVHAEKGKYECKATSSYGAAKKAADHWGLKSTAGIDAHLADKEKVAESPEVQENEMGGHPKALLMKVVKQMQDDAAMGDYTAIDDLLKDIPQDRLEGFLSEVESVQEEEDEEYDPRRVKADVVKHLVNMYNDAKKDDGYSSEKMHFALGNLLHDLDMAG